MATTLIPALIAGGMVLRPGCAVTGLRTQGQRINAVDCVDMNTRARITLRASHVIVAAGALATPHLLLSSGLQHLNPAGQYVGRMLMRHCNSIVFGVFPNRLDAAREFHKQLGFNDVYFGSDRMAGKLGTIQQIHGPPPGLVRAGLPGMLGRGAAHMIGRMTGLINIATDEPRFENRVTTGDGTDALGMRNAVVEHCYTQRDRAARAELERVSRRILTEAGAAFTVTMPVRTFSHALGSVRAGASAHLAPLDASLRFRGISNLHVTDGSCLPTSAGVNPSLTIAAMALRAGALLAGVTTRELATQRATLYRITTRTMAPA
jgi:choline dehydrogenase-like flavoprotein